ncbi:MAG TPA: YciI family protein [Vicinamibacterales bacterium]|jgi:uncharacterized protein YciI
MKCVMFYEPAVDGLAKAPRNYPAHKARVDEFARRGALLMVGTWANPADGALGIFSSRDAAEEFVGGDPFVQNGVVGRVTLKDWDEILN